MTRQSLRPLFNPSRRRLLRQGLIASGALSSLPGILGQAAFGFHEIGIKKHDISNIPNLSNILHEVSVEGDPATRMVIPRGFTVTEIARTGQPVHPGSSYLWHSEPDGGATFNTNDGGWIYVSNSEVLARRQGGVGAIRFDVRGEIIDAYSIASGTTNNCAGGPTPWGTWLSCEEIELGLVYECDPQGKELAMAIPAMGAFTHEAAAVDPVHKHIYLTEDMPDGCLYRFTPDYYPEGGRADLRTGQLEVAVVEGNDPFNTRAVSWVSVPYPVPHFEGSPPRVTPPTRKQVPQATKFNGGEGCWYHRSIVYFSSKGDNRIWALDTTRNVLDLIFDKRRDQFFTPGIADVDNITVSFAGDILVAEDGPNMRLVVIGPGSSSFELVNILGHRGSEITGPAFSPDGSRLYFSSQRGHAGNRRDGRTYEMQGPFFR
jgi:secreted PhoX family phosphatase